MKPIGLIVNPNAGLGEGALVGSELVARLISKNLDFIDLSGNTSDQALDQIANRAAEISGLLVVGGDGTVQLGTQLAVAHQLPLGIIPAGTGNDAARQLEIPVADLDAAFEVFIAALNGSKRVDVMKCYSQGKEFFSLGTISAGLDALVNQRANSLRFPKGPARYQVALLIELLRFRAVDYTLETETGITQRTAMLCAISNAGVFGGGMKIVPTAEINDGELDLFFVNRISKLELLRVFPKVYSGSHTTHPAVEISRIKKARLKAPNMPIFADGEQVGFDEIVVEVVPDGLRIWA